MAVYTGAIEAIYSAATKCRKENLNEGPFHVEVLNIPTKMGLESQSRWAPRRFWDLLRWEVDGSCCQGVSGGPPMINCSFTALKIFWEEIFSRVKSTDVMCMTGAFKNWPRKAIILMLDWCIAIRGYGPRVCHGTQWLPLVQSSFCNDKYRCLVLDGRR